MALIRCKECGKEISSKSAACPGCGAPIKRRNRFAIGCLTLIGIWLLIGPLAEITKKNSPSSSTTPTPGYTNLVASSSSTSAWTPPRHCRQNHCLHLVRRQTRTSPKSPTADGGRGGFDSVALWHVTFFNRSDKPISNIRYRTRYNAETGDQVDRGGVDALLGDNMIRKVISPHKKRTIDINDGFPSPRGSESKFRDSLLRVRQSTVTRRV